MHTIENYDRLIPAGTSYKVTGVKRLEGNIGSRYILNLDGDTVKQIIFTSYEDETFEAGIYFGDERDEVKDKPHIRLEFSTPVIIR
ncbi:MAG: hypothetical protein ACOVP4_14505 [Bacteriovoracaceae bacterium]